MVETQVYGITPTKGKGNLSHGSIVNSPSNSRNVNTSVKLGKRSMDSFAYETRQKPSMINGAHKV